jgi:site-specific DNA recombinase
MRVLGVIRLSDLSDETTSPERQRSSIEKYAGAYDHEIVGWAEDIDVSGAVSPFDRKDLGGWLTDAAAA